LKKFKVANTSTFSRSLQRENRATGGLDAEFLRPQTSSLPTSTQAGVSSRPISILFDASHKNLYTTLNGYKKLHRRLRASYEVSSTRDELTPADLIDHDLVVICAPATAFENSELAALHAFVSRGGSVLCLSRAGNAVGGGAMSTDEENVGSGAVPGGGDLTTTRERVKQQGNSRSQSLQPKVIIRDDMNEGNVLSNDKSGTSAAYLNTFLSHYGMKINNDCVIRAVFHKYLHPKECFVSKGCASIQFGKAVAKLHGRSKAATVALSNARGDSIPPFGGSDEDDDAVDDDEGGKSVRRSKVADGVEFIYPRGASVVISKPAIPLLTSGFVSYPVNKTICAVFQAPVSTTQQRSFSSSSAATITANTSPGINGGRVAVLGSSDMFSDEFISKECNGAIADALFRWFLQSSTSLKENENNSNIALNDEKTSIDTYLSNIIPAESTNTSSIISKRKQDEMTGKASNNVDEDSTKHIHIVPDTTSLAERLRGCLQESEPLPRDFTKLFDLKLYGFSPLMTTEAVALFNKLGVKHEPLTLIPPQFECPLPPLRPAVFPPQMREPLPPALELFDLDEHFASEKARLAQLTNKCGDEDLEYYVRECGHILGVSQRLQAMSNLSNVSSNSLSSSSSTVSSSSSSSTANEGSLSLPFKFGESRLRGNAALQPQQQLLLQQQQQQQQQSSAIQVLAFVFESIVNYKKLTQEPEPDVVQASIGYTGGDKSGKEGLNSIAVVPGGVALRQSVGAGGLGAGVAAKYKE
jgi:intraflagellar transport protein 52